MSKRIHCKGCGRWLFEVDADGRMLRARPRASELENYEPPAVDYVAPNDWVQSTRTVVRCTACGTEREWNTQIPLDRWRVE